MSARRSKSCDRDFYLDCWGVILSIGALKQLECGDVDDAGFYQHIGGLPDVKSQLSLTLFGVRSPFGVST